MLLVKSPEARALAVLRKPETRERFASEGGTPAPDVKPQAYGERLKNEHATYRKLIGELGLKPQ